MLRSLNDAQGAAHSHQMSWIESAAGLLRTEEHRRKLLPLDLEP